MTFTQIPVNGTLTVAGVAVTQNQTISITDINNADLVFTPAANASGTAYDQLEFSVHDDGGVADGGVDQDLTPENITFDVVPVNDAPAASNRSLAIDEDSSYTFNTADFGFSDAADLHSLQQVLIASVGGNGLLTHNGNVVTTPVVIPAADVSAGDLVFTPIPNTSGSNYSSIDFMVQDSGGTANGGMDTSIGANTVTINVIGVNDAPVGVDGSIQLLEDTTCLLYTSPSPRDRTRSRMPSSA